MAGILYCFNTISSHLIYKAGFTSQSLEARLRGYLGPSRPRVMVFAREVADAVEAERLTLALMRQCASLRTRKDMGREWFEADSSIDVDERHRQLIFIADVVQRAVLNAPPKRGGCTPGPVESRTRDAIDPRGGTLPGMHKYFRELDRFVGSADGSALGTVACTIRNFEAHPACPILPQYALFDVAARWAAACQRYPDVEPGPAPA